MKLLIAGASGFIGSALKQFLIHHECEFLVRRSPRSSSEFQWDPRSGTIDPAVVARADAIINLCGRNIAEKRWSPAFRQELYESRILPTRLLAQTLSTLTERKRVLISCSAIGYYGSSRDGELTEQSTSGTGFFATLGEAWEREALNAESSELRVVCPRIGVVLHPSGGALQKMLLPFRLGLGGKLGAGTQFFSWISLPDLLRALEWLLLHESLKGAVNLVAPNPVTNRDFTNALAAALRRPALFDLPKPVLHLLLGRAFADEALLSNLRVVPEELMKSGFQFHHKTIQDFFTSVSLR